MREHVERRLGFAWTTLLGGVIFMLPLAVVGYLLGQAVPIVLAIYNAIHAYLINHEKDEIGEVTIGQVANPDSPWTYTLLLLISFFILLGGCFVAGMIARRSLGQWFSGWAERYLLLLFPRYAVFKDQLTGNLGGGTLTPVVVQIGPHSQIAMEVEREENAQEGDARVTVYLPGSPDPWRGRVEIVPARNVTPIDAEYIDVMCAFEQLGRGTLKYSALAREAGRDPSPE
ncbi:hypothetical protein MalM25_01940 [Planctomycetes bacterium MalM25]|nr:hypothetical protein MalM25_01940 [Planctomycetes bacterium MalM25]